MSDIHATLLEIIRQQIEAKNAEIERLRSENARLSGEVSRVLTLLADMHANERTKRIGVQYVEWKRHV